MWNLAYAQEQAPATPDAAAADPAATTTATTTAADAPASPMEGMLRGPWLLMLVFIGVFYFLLIRPNQKREKERRDMLAALAKGDRVITSGGIVGTVIGLTEKTAVLRVSDEPPVKMEFVRGAVSRVMTKEEQKTEA